MSRPKRPAEPKEGIPGWLVSFTDMITLLLSFFVMLQSLARDRQPEMFFLGQGAFREAIASFGIPYFAKGRRLGPDRDFRNTMFSVPEDPNDTTRGRIWDYEGDEIRAIFKRISDQLATEASDLDTRTIALRPLAMTFSPGSAQLDAAARRELTQVATEWGASLKQHNISIYAIALAPDAPEGPRRWHLSAQRGEQVAQELRRHLAPQLQMQQWNVTSFGAGQGAPWTRKYDVGAGRLFVVLAVIQEERSHG